MDNDGVEALVSAAANRGDLVWPIGHPGLLVLDDEASLNTNWVDVGEEEADGKVLVLYGGVDEETAIILPG